MQYVGNTLATAKVGAGSAQCGSAANTDVSMPVSCFMIGSVPNCRHHWHMSCDRYCVGPGLVLLQTCVVVDFMSGTQQG